MSRDFSVLLLYSLDTNLLDYEFFAISIGHYLINILKDTFVISFAKTNSSVLKHFLL